MKAKLMDITSKLKKSFEEKFKLLENQQHATLAKERSKVAQTEMKNAQFEAEIHDMKKLVKKLEEEKRESKSKQDLSFQLVNNLQPKTGSDGNCKRCEALIFANGLYIEKIKKLKREAKNHSEKLN